MTQHGVDVSRFYKLDSIVMVPSTTRICDNETAVGCCDGKVIHVRFANDVEYHDKSAYLHTVVYHELGHCVLRLPHHEVKSSIMNPVLDRPSWFYRENWDYYMSEFFDYIAYINAHPNLKVFTP
jgi:hypothetical protein